MNLDEAYRQLGKKRPQPLPPGSYGFVLTTPGWKNVDRYVMSAIANCTIFDYIDLQTGKKAVIKYQPITFTLKNSDRFDRAYAYLLPNNLNSFMRVAGNNGAFTENLNELMSYQLVCVAWDGETLTWCM